MIMWIPCSHGLHNSDRILSVDEQHSERIQGGTRFREAIVNNDELDGAGCLHLREECPRARLQAFIAGKDGRNSAAADDERVKPLRYHGTEILHFCESWFATLPCHDQKQRPEAGVDFRPLFSSGSGYLRQYPA